MRNFPYAGTELFLGASGIIIPAGLIILLWARINLLAVLLKLPFSRRLAVPSRER